MRRLETWKTIIRDILTPLSGIVLLFYLASTPNERPSYFLGACAMVGVPVALLAASTRKDGGGGNGNGNGKGKEST